MNEKDSFFLMKKLLFLCREFCFFRKTYNFNMGYLNCFFIRILWEKITLISYRDAVGVGGGGKHDGRKNSSEN